jgi:hypothetical protein
MSSSPGVFFRTVQGRILLPADGENPIAARLDPVCEIDLTEQD